ncbi:unnamed protein product [Dovyalis caffra]|uniref:Uncharacterized protein n=1 Tax=Dovyalis caffra TaxID=77055 RepID=A0AAV1RW72_9ROSI|nr:unnamed protein product [Dovyalis caffra]
MQSLAIGNPFQVSGQVSESYGTKTHKTKYYGVGPAIEYAGKPSNHKAEQKHTVSAVHNEKMQGNLCMQKRCRSIQPLKD